jgi:hypothetical protein
MRNWKTSLPGFLAVLLQAASFYPPVVPFIGPITAVLVATGLYHAKDADKRP